MVLGSSSAVTPKTGTPCLSEGSDQHAGTLTTTFARNNQVDFLEPGWAYRIGQADLRDVEECNAIFAVVNGVPPDEGVMVELGVAIALRKPTFLFRDDHRRATESEEYPLNLMLFTGLPQDAWRDSFYTSVEEITAPDKALARWARETSPV